MTYYTGRIFLLEFLLRYFENGKLGKFKFRFLGSYKMIKFVQITQW